MHLYTTYGESVFCFYSWRCEHLCHTFWLWVGWWWLRGAAPLAQREAGLLLHRFAPLADFRDPTDRAVSKREWKRMLHAAHAALERKSMYAHTHIYIYIYQGLSSIQCVCGYRYIYIYIYIRAQILWRDSMRININVDFAADIQNSEKKYGCRCRHSKIYKKSSDLVAEGWQWPSPTSIHSSPIFRIVQTAHRKSQLLAELVIHIIIKLIYIYIYIRALLLW